MKRFFYAAAVVLLAACHSAIKNDDSTAVVQQDTVSGTAAAAPAVLMPVPAANNNSTVNVPADLVGYWVGQFEPDLPDDSMTNKAVSYNEGYWNRANKNNGGDRYRGCRWHGNG